MEGGTGERALREQETQRDQEEETTMARIRIEALAGPEQSELTSGEAGQVVGAGPNPYPQTFRPYSYSYYYPYYPPYPAFYGGGAVIYQPTPTAFGPFGPIGYYNRPAVIYSSPWPYGGWYGGW
jgi:hypothetical protein